MEARTSRGNMRRRRRNAWLTHPQTQTQPPLPPPADLIIIKGCWTRCACPTLPSHKSALAVGRLLVLLVGRVCAPRPPLAPLCTHPRPTRTPLPLSTHPNTAASFPASQPAISSSIMNGHANGNGSTNGGDSSSSSTTSAGAVGTFRVKAGLAQMLKGGVIMGTWARVGCRGRKGGREGCDAPACGSAPLVHVLAFPR